MSDSAVHPTLPSREISLLKDEIGGLMQELGIATVSFYEGEFNTAMEAIKGQFAKVIAANPWLAGRLEYDAKGVVCLKHPASPSGTDIDTLFTTIIGQDASVIAPNMQYTTICRNIYNSTKKVLIVGTGYDCVSKKSPVTILTLLESEPGKFALVFSISHAVADGRTYYEVYKMLQPGATVTSLKTDRVQTFSEVSRDIVGRKEMEWADSTSATCLYTCAMVPLMFGCAKAPRCCAFKIDKDRVAAAKRAAADAGEVPYVTTNDLLTSAFFTECGSRIGIMGMDCRTRVPGIGADLAGNYATALTMDPETFGTPTAVRKMLNQVPYKTTMMPLPTCSGWLCGQDSSKFAMATNWSSFAGGLIALEGCKFTIHLPVINPDYCLFDLMIPFMSAPGEMGVICWTVSSDAAGLKKALPVGDSVSTELFE